MRLGSLPTLLKQTIKAVVPQPFINWGKDKFHAVRLARIPRAMFDATNVGPAIDLRSAFAQCDSWESDGTNITDIYGADERSEGVNPGDRRALYYLVRFLKPISVLEIGTNVGASTLHIAMAMKANGIGALTTVDIVDVKASAKSPASFADMLGCLGRITFVVSDAQTFMMRQARYDLIFLDGDHSSIAVYQEVALALRLLAPGGRILLHDYYPKGMVSAGDVIYGPFRAMERVLRECPRVSVQPLGELPWPTRPDSHLTSLALVVRG